MKYGIIKFFLIMIQNPNQHQKWINLHARQEQKQNARVKLSTEYLNPSHSQPKIELPVQIYSVMRNLDDLKRNCKELINNNIQTRNSVLSKNCAEQIQNFFNKQRQLTNWKQYLQTLIHSLASQEPLKQNYFKQKFDAITSRNLLIIIRQTNQSKFFNKIINNHKIPDIQLNNCLPQQYIKNLKQMKTCWESNHSLNKTIAELKEELTLKIDIIQDFKKRNSDLQSKYQLLQQDLSTYKTLLTKKDKGLKRLQTFQKKQYEIQKDKSKRQKMEHQAIYKDNVSNIQLKQRQSQFMLDIYKLKVQISNRDTIIRRLKDKLELLTSIISQLKSQRKGMVPQQTLIRQKYSNFLNRRCLLDLIQHLFETTKRLLWQKQEREKHSQFRQFSGQQDINNESSYRSSFNFDVQTSTQRYIRYINQVQSRLYQYGNIIYDDLQAFKLDNLSAIDQINNLEEDAPQQKKLLQQIEKILKKLPNMQEMQDYRQKSSLKKVQQKFAGQVPNFDCIKIEVKKLRQQIIYEISLLTFSLYCTSNEYI